MKRSRILYLPILSALLICGLQNSLYAQNDPEIEKLISQMSIEEKVGQMTQLNLDVISQGAGIYQLDEPHQLDQEKLKKAIIEYHVGSILNCGGHAYTREHWLDIIAQIQQMATRDTRLHIPVLYGIDAIHGANYTLGATLFPQPIAQAATFDPVMAHDAAAVTAYEVKASGITWNFSPVLDLARQPLWSRVFETYGEDVLVDQQFGVAVVKGYQGNHLADPGSVAACMKHFVGYGFSRTGKDRTPAYIPEILLREYYLPSFEAAIQSGAATVMINSGEINGIPVHADHRIVTDLLRNELGFNGVAVTDWEDIMKLVDNHHVAENLKDAVRMAIEAGIDMSMVPNDYRFSDLLIELVKEGTIPESRLDESVRRILLLKKQLGLFDHPLPPATADYPEFGSKKSKDLSRSIAESSITLLKNEGQILPLAAGKKILVTGPGANSMTMLNGAWTRTWQGVDTTWNDPERNTILKALQQIGGNQVQFVAGCSINKITNADAALQAAKNADIIIACMGENPATEIPGNINSLDLDPAQIEYLKILQSSGKPVVLVLTEGRPRIIREIADGCSAIVLTYLPGDFGGEALANILYGKVNPSGKLPYTYPKYANDLTWYDHKYTESFDTNFGHNGYDPQWPFGFGMSYTEFKYSNMHISNDTITGKQSFIIQVDITNTGSAAGKEVAELFIADRVASITPPVKKLRGFEKISIDPGATSTVRFTLTAKDLSFVGADMQWITEKGWFDAMLGDQKISFYYQP